MNLLSRFGAAWGALQAGSIAAKSAFAQAFVTGRDADEDLVGRGARWFQPYRQSAWVYSAVNFFANELSGRPLRFLDGKNTYDDAAFAEFWAAPALGPNTLGATQPRLSQAQFSRDLASWAKLEGEWFLVRGDDWLVTVRPDPRKLSPLLIAHPHRMRLIVQGGVLQGYEYVDAGGKRFIFLPEQVTHWKAFNPYDDWRGLGAMQAASVAAEGVFVTGVYIRELMRNNGDTGYIVIGKAGIADDRQRDQIVAALDAKRRALRRGVARDIFVTGDIAVDRPAEQSAGGDLNAGKALSHQEIYVAFDVPPSFAEVKASYSVGKDSDYFQFIIRGCVPLGMNIAGGLAPIASFLARRPVQPAYYWDDHVVMIEVRNSRVDIGLKLWSTGWSWQAINEFLMLGMKGFDGWDERYLPFSVAPADAAEQPPADPVQDPALAEPKAIQDPDVLALQLVLLARQRPAPACRNVTPAADEFAMFACGCCRAESPNSADSVAQKAERSAKDIALWRSHMRQRQSTVKSFRSAFGRVLMQARVETLKKIETWHKGKESGVRSQESGEKTRSPITPDPSPVLRTGLAAHLLFALDKFTATFDAVMAAQEKSGLQTAGQQFLSEVGNDDLFLFPPAEVLDYLAVRKNKLRDVPQSVYDRVKEQLEEGLVAGDSTDDLAKRVKTVFNDLGDGEARRIAMTETSAVYGAGRDQAMKQAGVQYKSWLTSGNANVRAAHQVAGEEYGPDNAIPVDEPFIVDGEELMFPGDDAGSAGNVINCHCISIAVAAPGTDS